MMRVREDIVICLLCRFQYDVGRLLGLFHVEHQNELLPLCFVRMYKVQICCYYQYHILNIIKLLVRLSARGTQIR